MKKIIMYGLKGREREVIEIPKDAVILSAKILLGSVILWVKIDSENKALSPRMFRIISSGINFDDAGLTYIDSIEKDGYVWHIFEEVRL